MSDKDKGQLPKDRKVQDQLVTKANEALGELPEDLRNAALERIREELEQSDGLVPVPTWGLKVIVGFGVLYALNLTFGVVELIPDNIPFVGLVDDGTFLWLSYHANRVLEGRKSWVLRRDDEVLDRFLSRIHGYWKRLWGIKETPKTLVDSQEETDVEAPSDEAAEDEPSTDVVSPLADLDDETVDPMDGFQDPRSAKGEVNLTVEAEDTDEEEEADVPGTKSLALRFWEWLQT